MKVLLLNPPARHKILRDYFCSHISKGSYLWQPVDLMYISGLLLNSNIEFSVLDCIAFNKDKKYTIKFIQKYRPDYIISLTGAVSFKTDIYFFREIKKIFPKIILILTGDIIFHNGITMLRNYPDIDGIIKSFADIGIGNDIISNKKNGRFGKDPETNGPISLHIPYLKPFISNNYFLPYIKRPEFGTILVSYSCPERCFFCPFENIPYKRRKVPEILKELEHLKKNGIKTIFFRDQSFMPDDDYYREIMNILKKLDIEFSISSRIKDLTNENSLRLLKESGCYLIQIGVESYNIKNIKRKILSQKTTKLVFNNIKKAGIKTLAHFIVGFPDENIITIFRNLAYIFSLSPDYLSLNTLTPQPGTTFFKSKFPNGFDFEKYSLDSSISKSIIKNTNFRIMTDIHRKILAIAFYSSPRFIYNSLFKTNLYQKKLMLKELYNYIRVKG